MPDAKTLLLLCLGILALAFIAFWVHTVLAARRSGATLAQIAPTPYQLLVGFITDFLDSWGVGSFATTTSLYRARRTIDDRLLPGTLNVGHALPTVLQALLFIDAVQVDVTTLVLMILGAVLGALLGARFVARWPRRRIQMGMGVALLVLCGFIVYRQLAPPTGGEATGFSGPVLVVAVAGNFMLGALMTIGIGLYAPCLVMVCLLGLNAKAAFPIMMGSCAFLMPPASVPFMRQGSFSLRAALGLTLAGLPAVWLATYLFKQLDENDIHENIHRLQWVVVAVVIYTAITLLRAARKPVSS